MGEAASSPEISWLMPWRGWIEDSPRKRTLVSYRSTFASERNQWVKNVCPKTLGQVPSILTLNSVFTRGGSMRQQRRRKIKVGNVRVTLYARHGANCSQKADNSGN